MMTLSVISMSYPETVVFLDKNLPNTEFSMNNRGSRILFVSLII